MCATRYGKGRQPGGVVVVVVVVMAWSRDRLPFSFDQIFSQQTEMSVPTQQLATSGQSISPLDLGSVEEFTLGEEPLSWQGRGAWIRRCLQWRSEGVGNLPCLQVRKPVPQLSLTPTAVPDSPFPTTSRKIRP